MTELSETKRQLNLLYHGVKVSERAALFTAVREWLAEMDDISAGKSTAPELKELLRQHAAVSFEAHGASAFLPELRQRRISIEERIGKLFVEAGEAGARLEREQVEGLLAAFREILETSKHFYTQTAGFLDNEPMFLPPELTPYAGPLAVIFKVADEAIKNYQARNKSCICHQGSVCTPACEQGKHHEGCVKESK